MGHWRGKVVAFAFAVIFCCMGSGLAEDVTYGDDPGSKPIPWVDNGNGSIRAILGPTDSASGTSDSITGNTITIKNYTVPPLPPSASLSGSRYIRVYGANNFVNSNPVTGNTIIRAHLNSVKLPSSIILSSHHFSMRVPTRGDCFLRNCSRIVPAA